MPELDTYTACAIVEGFDGPPASEKEQLAAWQYLINTGIVWKLQGWYGRAATALIEAGLCTR